MLSPDSARAPSLIDSSERRGYKAGSCCDQANCLQCFVLAWANKLPTPKSRRITIDSPFCSRLKAPPHSRRAESLNNLISPKKRWGGKGGGPATPTRSTSFTAGEDADEEHNDKTPIPLRRSRLSTRKGSDALRGSGSSPSRTLASSAAILPTNLGHVPKLPSAPTTESSVSRGTSRASSPNKKRNIFTLQALEEYPITAVKFRRLGDLPSDVHPVYEQILELVNNGRPIIPRKWKDFFAEDLERIPKYITERLLLSGEEESSFAEIFQQADLAIIAKIQKMALRCDNRSEAEAAWNCEVHSPLFDLAFRRSGLVDSWNITSARMSSAAKIRDGDNRALEKLVDFGVTLEEPVIARQHVIERLRSFRAETVGINQSIYPPLLYSPLALSIETKASSSSEDDAFVQLSVWTASQFKMLRRYQSNPEASALLPTLPVISTYKGSFSLHFAVPQENGMLFIKNAIQMGDVTVRLDAWRVYLALKRLERWAVEVYGGWFRREILGMEEMGNEEEDGGEAA